MSDKQTILFVCTHNSARSQMAEGLMRHLADDRFDVYSAGTVARGVHPLAVLAMADRGIDIRNQTSDVLEKWSDIPFDFVLTVCDNAREACPYVPARIENTHHAFSDPSAEAGTENDQLAAFIRVRDEIEAFLKEHYLRD